MDSAKAQRLYREGRRLFRAPLLSSWEATATEQREWWDDIPIRCPEAFAVTRTSRRGCNDPEYPQPSTMDQDGPLWAFALLVAQATALFIDVTGWACVMGLGVALTGAAIVAETCQVAGFLLAMLFALSQPLARKTRARQAWLRVFVVLLLLGQAVGGGSGTTASYPGAVGLRDQAALFGATLPTMGPAWGLWEPPTLHECFLSEKYCRQWLSEHKDVRPTRDPPPDLFAQVDVNEKLSRRFGLSSRKWTCSLCDRES